MSELVLITGGSGFLGINMVRYLLEKGITRIRVFDLVPFDYPEQDRVEFVAGDIRDNTAVQEAMEGVTWVVHTAAALPLYKPADIMSTDVDGTGNLLEAAAAVGVSRFIHISSTAVYGIPDHHPLLENDR
ncbi:MAG TPA: NAD-dependent epimerase/dehydratase family protein, partial [Bacteroidales bacterium]|nr:NAD-dependent epimerase/dehydratase family protein [Bacteroidales bacterium]